MAFFTFSTIGLFNLLFVALSDIPHLAAQTQEVAKCKWGISLQ